MKRLRIAVVGCGAAAEIHHLPVLRRARETVAVAAVVDPDAARAQAVAKRHDAAWFTTYTELPGKVDAALIATPNATHAEIACFLLARGIHVLCEKPMATTVADAEKMLAAAATGGARVMAGQCRRFSPNAETVHALVRAGRLGTVRRIEAALGGSQGHWPERTDFRRQRSLSGGGVLLDLGIHLIDLVVWLTGEAVSVRSYRASDALGWGVESDVDLVLGLASGGEARLSCSYTHGLDRTLRIEGSDGWATTSVDPFPEVRFFSRRARVCQRAGALLVPLPEVDPYARQLGHFLDGIRRGTPFTVRDTEVVGALRVAEHCYQVARAA